MSTTREPFESECWYHVFNHARGNDALFEKPIDFKIFLELIARYIVPVADVYTYCLMPNHFHFLIRFKDVLIPESFSSKHMNDFLAHQWGNVQNTYTKKKNYRTGKRGGLFCQSINRNLINSEEYQQMCVVYIHNNPVKHGFCIQAKDWEQSSYNTLLSEKPTSLEREEVLSWFENRKNFIDYHNSNAADIFAEKYNLR